MNPTYMRVCFYSTTGVEFLAKLNMRELNMEASMDMLT